MFSKKFGLLLSVLVIASFVLASCAAPAAAPAEPQVVEVTRVVEKEGQTIIEVVTATPEPKGGDTLYMRLSEDPESLDSVLTNSLTANSVIANYLTDRLVYFDADGMAQPWLAKSWEVSEDQTELTFFLQEGVKFHDGTDFNAEAVKANFDRMMDPANASPKLGYLGSLQEVVVVDDLTVTFVFEKPYAPFFINLAGAVGAINSPTAVEQYGETYGRSPVGTGPFMFEEWIPGSSITLVRNPDYKQFRKDVYNQGPALAEKIVLVVIPEEGTVQAALETGEIISADLAADIVARFVGDPAYNVIIDKNVANVVFLEFNFLKPPFDDIRVRKAVNHAVDKAAAIRAAWNGYAEPALSPLPLGDPGFSAEIAAEYGYEYDPEKALALFEEAGFTQNADGIMVDAAGAPVVWKVTSYAGFTHINRTLEVVQANLKDLGIEMVIETAEWGAFYASLQEPDADWDMELMRWTDRDPSILSNIYRSPGHIGTYPAGPWDEVLDRCDATMDPAERFDCIGEAQKLLLENASSVPILTNWSMYAVRKEVMDYHLDYTGYLLASDIWIQK